MTKSNQITDYTLSKSTTLCHLGNQSEISLRGRIVTKNTIILEIGSQ